MRTTMLKININEETLYALKLLAAREDTSVTEIVRRAVSIHKYLSDKKLKGRKFYEEKANGRHRREIILNAYE